MRNLTNQKFGRLTAIKPVGTNKHHRVIWKCLCDCGNVLETTSDSLIKGRTKSCGCLAHEYRTSGQAHRQHGGCGTRLYRIWKGMKRRCNNVNNPDYQKWYGKYGIKVCDEWNDFEKFREWSLSNGYNDSLSIDRIDYTKGYSPDNCRWVTAREQSNNRKGVDKITFNNQTHTISEWGTITGLGRSTIYNRIKVYGWDIERALTTPKRGRLPLETKMVLEQ